MSDVEIRSATAADAAAIASIYNPFVTQTVVTFEEETVTPDAMARRIADVQSLDLPWLVAERDGRVIGYAYAGRWRTRSAYRHSAETTIYLEPGVAGHGIGTRLYSALLGVLRTRPIHSAIGGVALPNAASVALHEKLGFRPVGTFREVGFKLGRWVDVGYWHLVLS